MWCDATQGKSIVENDGGGFIRSNNPFVGSANQPKAFKLITISTQKF